MKKIFSFFVTMVFMSISFAQSGGGGGAGESTEHPASQKKAKDDVRLMDETYKNPSSAHKSEKLNKKTKSSRTGNGVIDENAPGGMGNPESKDKKKTE